MTDELSAAAAGFVDAAPVVEAAPPEEASTPAAPCVPTSDVLFPLARLAFDKAAPLWSVSDDEVRSLCGAYGDLLDKYFPDGFLDRFGVELSALLVTLVVIGPRWGTPMKPAPMKPPAAPAVTPVSVPPAGASAAS